MYNNTQKIYQFKRFLLKDAYSNSLMTKLAESSIPMNMFGSPSGSLMDESSFYRCQDNTLSKNKGA